MQAVHSNGISGDWPRRRHVVPRRRRHGDAYEVVKQAPHWKYLFKDSGALPRGISIGVAVDDKLADGLPQTERKYNGHAYGYAWATARKIRGEICQLLAGKGFTVYPPVQKPVDPPGGVSKMVARLSGLGWIGKSSLLVTPERGPRAWWETVLTDAPLQPTAAKPMERQCGDCTRCIDICPVSAYRDVEFSEKDQLAVRYDSGKCSRYRFGILPGGGSCTMCVKVCPFGRHQANLLEETLKKAALLEEIP